VTTTMRFMLLLLNLFLPFYSFIFRFVVCLTSFVFEVNTVFCVLFVDMHRGNQDGMTCFKENI